MSPALVWFIVGAVLALLEFVVPGIVLIFFAASAWVVAGLSALGVPMNLAVQILVWVTLGVALLFSLRRWLTGQLTGFTLQKGDLNKIPQEAVGAHVEVVEAIKGKGLEGRVRWKGTLWRAVADEPIEAGTMVEVISQENLILRVKRME